MKIKIPEKRSANEVFSDLCSENDALRRMAFCDLIEYKQENFKKEIQEKIRLCPVEIRQKIRELQQELQIRSPRIEEEQRKKLLLSFQSPNEKERKKTFLWCVKNRAYDFLEPMLSSCKPQDRWYFLCCARLLASQKNGWEKSCFSLLAIQDLQISLEVISSLYSLGSFRSLFVLVQILCFSKKDRRGHLFEKNPGFKKDSELF